MPRRRQPFAPLPSLGSFAQRLLQRLLRLSLFAKLLIANSAIVALGATVGTYVTTLHAKAALDATDYAMMGVFGAAGLAVSLVANALVLQTALRPLARLERTARRVLAGDLDARARLGAIGDPGTDQLARTFNAMLDRLQARQRQIEAFAARLQELSDRVLLAQEDERRRLAGELHDDTGQVLSSLLLQLRLFRDAAARPGADPAALAEQAAGLAELAREVLDGIRRMALELRPRMLEDLGLAAALRAYTDEWSGRTGIALGFHAALLPGHALPSAAEIAIYRLVQEALANVARHAAAHHVDVTLAEQGDAVVVEVHDNGCGFMLGPDLSMPGRAAEQRAGLGLFSMQERIALAGGTFHIESAPGRGTTVRAVLPLARAAPPAPAGGDGLPDQPEAYPVAVSGVK